MIKLIFRRNLIYLLLLIISYFLRRVLLIFISKIYGIDNSFIFVLLMFLAEFLGGLVVYIYQKSFLDKNRKERNENNLVYKIIKKEKELKKADNWWKIYLLIFFCSVFDFTESIIISDTIPKISTLSTTATLRLCCIITITSTLLCYFTLRFKIAKHQTFSLIIMGVCFAIIIILEFIYRPKETQFGNFFVSYLLVICHFILISFNDVTERYLFDFDFLNPLLILMTEGIFGILISSLYSLYKNPFKEIKYEYYNLDTWEFVGLIFMLILYFIFSAGLNVYKILCNVLYSPMTKSLTSYFLNSIYIIYYFVEGNDFIIDNQRNYFLFFVNLFLSIFIDFLGLIYNEIIILKFCGLDDNTHYGISDRAISTYIEMIENKDKEDFDENHDYIENEENDTVLKPS